MLLKGKKSAVRTASCPFIAFSSSAFSPAAYTEYYCRAEYVPWLRELTTDIWPLESPAGTSRRESCLPAHCCEQGEMIEMGKASFAHPLCETVKTFSQNSIEGQSRLTNIALIRSWELHPHALGSPPAKPSCSLTGHEMQRSKGESKDSLSPPELLNAGGLSLEVQQLRWVPQPPQMVYPSPLSNFRKRQATSPHFHLHQP